MSRPRIPTNILEARGSFDSHADRKKARELEPKNINEVGEPPEHLSELESEAFMEIVKLAIPGVLGEADRLAVEMAAVLLIKCRGQYEIDGEIVPAMAAEQSQFFKYLSQFGMTPANRSAISIIPPEKKEEHDPWADL